jgi:hypothetical protein
MTDGANGCFNHRFIIIFLIANYYFFVFLFTGLCERRRLQDQLEVAVAVMGSTCGVDRRWLKSPI